MVPRLLLFAFVALLGTSLLQCQPRPRSFAGSESKGSDEVMTVPAPPSLDGAFGEIAEIDLSRGAPELPATSLLGGPPSGAYFQLIGVLRTVVKESSSRGIFVRFGGARLGWARAEEIGRLLEAAREAGKSVVCHAEGYSNTTAWIAARGCERIWLSPAGTVETTGIAAQVVYANRLLTEKLGVKIDMLQIGKYKGADESFTRDGPSAEARESLESTLAALRETWLEGFRGRGARAVEAAEDGPFDANEARALGLVDAVGYLDEARDDAEQLVGSASSRRRFGPGTDRASGFAEILRALSGGSSPSIRRPHVAVVRAIGAITMERSGGLFSEGSGITERGLSRTIRQLASDDSAKAVVLRIDSPGGSALASDLLWHELMKLREKKPIVVSIGDMAASGGYYLASTATTIVAEKTSIVGSIGVVGGKLAFGPALEPYGVHVETFSPNPRPEGKARAAYESPLVPWDEATRARVEAVMRSTYALFVERVAEGRGVPVSALAGATEGRLFAGEAASRLGLIDEWGGFEQAIARAKEIAELRQDAPVRLVSERGGLLDWLDLEEGMTEEAELPGAYAVNDPRTSVLRAVAPEVLSFLSSAEPLLHGERTLTALPFAIFLR